MTFNNSASLNDTEYYVSFFVIICSVFRVVCFFSAPFCGQNIADIRCDGTYFCISIAENGRVACLFSAPFCGQNAVDATLRLSRGEQQSHTVGAKGEN